MGWLFMRDCGRFDGPRAYLDDQLTYVRDDHRLRVLRSALVGLRTYYAACERVTSEGERSVFAVVCLVRYNRRAADGMTFGYKDMDETVGPCEADCPAAILELLTPTDRPHALGWRARCRANLATRARCSAKPTPRPGQTILFDTPLRLSNGLDVDRFEVVADGHNGRKLLFREPRSRALCWIARVKRYAYRLIDPVRLVGAGETAHG